MDDIDVRDVEIDVLMEALARAAVEQHGKDEAACSRAVERWIGYGRDMIQAEMLADSAGIQLPN